VFTTARKLRHYFTVYLIIVVNEAPLSNILNNPEATGCVSLWGIELSPLDITYEKRKAIKSQILPDFTAEWLELQNAGPPDLSSVWTMYFVGSTRVEGAGRLDNVFHCIYKSRRSWRRSSNNIAIRR
jgi:hypothetical protein